MLDMMRRHAIHVLREAGHTQAEVARLAGTTERTVRRVEGEPMVKSIDSGESRKGAIGRPSKAKAYRSFIAEVLEGEPEVLSLEILRRARLAGYRGGKSCASPLFNSLLSVGGRRGFAALHRGAHGRDGLAGVHVRASERPGKEPGRQTSLFCYVPLRATPGGPSSRNPCHVIAGTAARSAVASPVALQTTSGLKPGWRRVNSRRPVRSFTWNLPVFTSIAHLPQLPSRMPSTSSGSSRQYETPWPEFHACARQAFSTHAPKRAGSAAPSAIPWGSTTAMRALLSVTNFGGAALRLAARVEYFGTGVTRNASSRSAR